MTSRTLPDRGPEPDDRGVTEVLSFILTFSIIFSMVIVAGLVGFGAIEDYRESEQVGNAERAMDAFADNVNDLVRYDGVQRRSGELALRGGTADPGADGTKVDISIRKGGDRVWNSTDTFGEDVGAFTYEKDGETVAYEGGAVFRASDAGSVALTDPMITVRDDTVLLSLVVIEESDRSINSPRGVEFDVRETNSDRYYVEGANVSVRVAPGGADPSRADAWNATFEDDDAWGRDPSDPNAWVPKVGSDDLSVSVDVVAVEVDYPELG